MQHSAQSGTYEAVRMNAALTAMATKDRPQGPPLPIEYQPTHRDVCSGRGKKHWNLPGNIAFRTFIQTKVQEYLAETTKVGKTSMVSSIVNELRFQGFRFLKQNKDGFWYDIGDKQARDKVGHSLRDQVTAIRKAEAEGEIKAPMVRRPSICLSDSGHESDLRRSELASTNMYASFARRPSWIAGEQHQQEDREDSWHYVDKFMELDVASIPDDDEDTVQHAALELPSSRPNASAMSPGMNPPPMIQRKTSEDPAHALMKDSFLSFDARMSIVSNTAAQTPFRRSSILSGRSSLRNFTSINRLSDISMASEIFDALGNTSFSASSDGDLDPLEIAGL